ncbi:MAG TPA: L-seryl-tRNA(Sec) selenium transferase [Bryobacteraceae bacterium]|nr:L-seryl-tRNA(Sec) selenium transferase [Bryobacteraceae bacterium]
MADPHVSRLSSLPSVERLLTHGDAAALIAEFGRTAVTSAIRDAVARARAGLLTATDATPPSDVSIIQMAIEQLRAEAVPSLRRVFNLTGIVIHTNLGRATLPDTAIDAVTVAAREPTNLEFDLQCGRRGDREAHLEERLRRLTGAAAATVVNNNAAAVLLVLNSLANRKEVVTSRGELIEIGGSFRMPDIMARSGCRLREVGTTNRTHLADYDGAIGPKTGLVMKVHTSNYTIEGFTAAAPEAHLARLCHEHGVPFVVDLGSGTLIDLQQFGLPHEPTPSESIANGADLVTFSGDKLLGGPQAGIVVGRADLVRAINRNPLKRALRIDKMTVAALSAVLRLYSDPERLRERLPALRLLTRPVESIRALADRMREPMTAALEGIATVESILCESQIGSGALPARTIPSAGLAIRPALKKDGGKRGTGPAPERIARAFRELPVPVIGRIQDGAFILDFRCLEDAQAFAGQLPVLKLDRASSLR